MPVFRMADIRGYPRTWQRILTILAHHPGRGFTGPELAEIVYADREDGGPLDATGVMFQLAKLYSDLVPDGWRLRRPGQGFRTGYALIPILPAAHSHARVPGGVPGVEQVAPGSARLPPFSGGPIRLERSRTPEAPRLDDLAARKLPVACTQG